MKAIFKHLFSFYLKRWYSKHLFSMCIVTLREKNEQPCRKGSGGTGQQWAQQEPAVCPSWRKQFQWHESETQGERFVGKGKILYLVSLELVSVGKDTNKTVGIWRMSPVTLLDLEIPKFSPPNRSQTLFSAVQISPHWRWTMVDTIFEEITNFLYVDIDIQVFVYLTSLLQCLNTDLSLKNLSL